MIKAKYFFLVATLTLCALIPFSPYAAETPSSMQCRNQALEEAKKFLAFYRDNDDRISIEGEVTPLKKIENPEKKSQQFDVLEVWGYLYKGKYRMRFIYYSAADCTLMGEEILEFAHL